MTKNTSKTLHNFLYIIIFIHGCLSMRNVRIRSTETEYKISNDKKIYYLLESQKINPNTIKSNILDLSLFSIDENYNNLPIFISFDDTFVKKNGKHFYGCKKFFDHSIKEGSKYINANNFLANTISIPRTSDDGKISYTHIPLGVNLYSGHTTKIEMEKEFINQIEGQIENKKTFFLFDSWYSNKKIISIFINNKNFSFICAAKLNTKLREVFVRDNNKTYKGRPRKYGKYISVQKIIETEKPICFDDYNIYTKLVYTNIIKNKAIHAIITKSKTGSIRLFLTSINDISTFVKYSFKSKIINDAIKTKNLGVICYSLYKQRWNIETFFEEIKMYWDFTKYKVRSKKKIETLTNILTSAYAIMRLLPLQSQNLAPCLDLSIQETRQILSDIILQDCIFRKVAPLLETHEKSAEVLKILRREHESYTPLALAA